jgi:hypothetical protein
MERGRVLAEIVPIGGANHHGKEEGNYVGLLKSLQRKQGKLNCIFINFT